MKSQRVQPLPVYHSSDILQIIVDSAKASSSAFQNDISNLQAAINSGNAYSFSSLSLAVSSIEQFYVLTDFAGWFSPLIAQDDAVTVSNIGPQNIAGLLHNDLHFGYTDITIANISQTSNGTATLQSNGSVNYLPNAGFVGEDSFDYIIQDAAGNSSTATVEITVDAAHNIPVVWGSANNETLYGTSSAEAIYGLSGADYIYGNGGNDALFGGEGVDYLYGGGGDDYLEDLGYTAGVNYQSYLYGGAGNDTLVGGEGKQYFRDGNGGGDYNHYIDYGSTDEYYVYDPGGDEVRITDFGGFRDYMAFPSPYPLNYSNTIFERYLDHDLRVKTNTGNVNIVMTDQFTDLENQTGIGVEKLYISGSWLDLKSYISNYTNQMVTRGSDGDDTIYGIQIANPDDLIYAGNGDDVLYGSAGSDTLYGDAGNDIIDGGVGNDVLYGGAGNDLLTGQEGQDTLTGGEGADIFDFTSADVGVSVDMVTDFDKSEGDALDVSGLLSGYDPVTDAIANFVQITDNGTDSTLAVDADGGADNFVTIETLQNVTGLNVETLETNGNLLAA